MATIDVQTKACEIDEALQKRFEERLAVLERHWDNELDALVRVRQHRGRHAVEITLTSGSVVMRGEEKATTARQAFDLAAEKLEGQLRRFKEKLRTRARRHDNRDDVAGVISRSTMANAGIGEDGISTMDSSANGAASTSSTRASDGVEQVVRTKRFALKPMSPEEASLQMDLLGHSFFVFRDADNHQVSVVYRRHDGGVGLIEPVAD